MDSFYVSEENGGKIAVPGRWQEVEQALRTAIDKAGAL